MTNDTQLNENRAMGERYSRQRDIVPPDKNPPDTMEQQLLFG